MICYPTFVTDLALLPRTETTLVPQADTDAQLIEMWLHGRGAHTQRAYRADVNRFLALVKKPLRQVTLRDCQTFVDSLEGQSNTQKRTISSVKSLFSFAQRIGYVVFNVTAPIRLPKMQDKLAERILPEAEVHRIIALTENQRDRMILRLLYISGVRVSELAHLRWQDTQANGETGQITVFGKGGKTRAIVLPQYFWKDLMLFRGDVNEDAPIFPSRKKYGPLTTVQILRIVQKAAQRAGIGKNVSPHWFRHAHCSHAMERGALIHLVQATAGHSSVAVTGRYLHAKPTDSSAKYIAG